MVFSAKPGGLHESRQHHHAAQGPIASQILTHYPARVEIAQRSPIRRPGPIGVCRSDAGMVPRDRRQVAFEARGSEFVDQKSGVSARLSIAAYENLISNLERRWLLTGDPVIWPRIVDLQALVPAVSGKIELVYEGEQQGPDAVARHIIGQAVKTVFHKHFPKTTRETKRKRERPGGAAAVGEHAAGEPNDVYDRITGWFSGGNRIEISDIMPAAAYATELRRVAGLEELARRFLPAADPSEVPSGLEFVLEGLYQSSFVAKETVERSTFYSDMLMRMFQGME
jgi:magnesium chelatase subunit I